MPDAKEMADQAISNANIETLSILIVDDSTEDRMLYKRLLMQDEDTHYIITEVASGYEALEICNTKTPDCILLDYNMPDIDGLEILHELSRNNTEIAPPVVMLTGEKNLSVAIEAMKNGAQDYLTKGDVTFESLKLALNNAVEKITLKRLLKMREDELKHLALTDDLTGLYSRRYVREQLQQELHRASRYKIPFCIALIDLDHFKQVNDHHGHPTGDRVLIAFSKLLSQCTRQSDTICRYGGEEFLIVLPNTLLKSARIVTDRICTQAEALVHRGSTGESFQVTCSQGLTEFEPSITDAEKLIQRADEALYQAKNLGRNQVCIWANTSPSATTPNLG